MAPGRHETLHQFVMERAGRAYRTAFHYREDDWTELHIRDDLATRELESNLPDVFEKLRRRRALLPETDYPPLGETDATTEIHDHGVLVHFPEGPNEGVIVSLDRVAARRLTGFVLQCQNILQTSPSVASVSQEATD